MSALVAELEEGAGRSEYLGCSAIEDVLQDNLKDSIEAFRR